MSFFKNVLTFGAHSRIEKRIAQYERNHQTMLVTFHELEEKAERATISVNQLVIRRQSTLELLNYIEKQSKELLTDDNNLITVVEHDYCLVPIGFTNDTIITNTLQSVTWGAAIGLSATSVAAATSNYLASAGMVKIGMTAALGTIKTGSIIVGTKAAIAAGSLKALGIAGLTKASVIGGTAGLAKAGIVGGVAVKATTGAFAATVGAIALPVAGAIMAVISHSQADKEIERINDEECRILDIMKKYKTLIIKCDGLDKRALEIDTALTQATTFLSSKFEKFKKIMIGNPLTRIVRKIRKFFGYNLLSDREEKNIFDEWQIIKKLHLEVSDLLMARLD